MKLSTRLCIPLDRYFLLRISHLFLELKIVVLLINAVMWVSWGFITWEYRSSFFIVEHFCINYLISHDVILQKIQNNDCSIRVIMQIEIEKQLKGHHGMSLWQRYTIQSRFPLLSVTNQIHGLGVQCKK